MSEPSVRLPLEYDAIEVSRVDPEAPSFEVVRKRLDRIPPGRVLVAMDSAPVNPSDVKSLKGDYTYQPTAPYVPGTVGKGRVVASGGGLRAQALKGRRVACGSKAGEGGTWAEYVLTDPTYCVPLTSGLHPDHATNLLSNPMTAAGILESLRARGHRRVVQTAGASDIGRLVAQLGPSYGLEVTSLVRRAHQADELSRRYGATYLDQSAEGFHEALRERLRTRPASALLDCVGGDAVQPLMASLETGGLVMTYGKLSGDDLTVDIDAILRNALTVEGFNIYDFGISKTILGQLRFALQLQRRLANAEPPTVQARIALDELGEHVDDLLSGRVEGKVYLQPGSTE